MKENFDTTVDGKRVALYTIRNLNGMRVDITNLGGKVVSIIVPDRDGKPTDVALGHDTIEDYIASEEQYFGAICGRYANRITRGRFEIDGTTYSLAINNGPNALHGGLRGFNAVVWEMVEHTDTLLKLSYVSPDGEEGYPGTLSVTVTYSVGEANELRIDYGATTSRPTVLNLTNHSYFNLSGEGDPSVHDHELVINARTYLPTDDTAIPYGAPAPVAGTPMDFNAPHTIGERIDEPVDQLVWARGYDHTFVIDKPLGSFDLCAICSSPKSGITLSVWSTEPGMQVYTGNWMSGNMRGKGSSRYPARSAVCFETQHFPDSPNHTEYPSTVLRPGEDFTSRTVYAFGIKS